MRRAAPGVAWALGRLLLGLAVAGLAWEGAVVLLGVRPAYLPRLSAILAAVAETPGAYFDGFLRTLGETLIGFAAGAAVGVLNGVAFFRWPLLRDMLFPVFVVSQTIPVIAFGALVVLWFGNTLLAKAVIAFYLTFFPVTVNTLLGLQSVDPAQVALLRSFGAGARSLMLRLQLPAALPQGPAAGTGPVTGPVRSIAGSGPNSASRVPSLSIWYSAASRSATKVCLAALHPL